MAATQTVAHVSSYGNSDRRTLRAPRNGVITLFGYGITIRVDHGHLILDDGIGAERRRFRLARVGHGLRRLVVIGADGLVSLAALRWLADQKDSAFVMLDRDGSVLTATARLRSSDARLRRAQALAGHSEVGLRIVRELITQKLVGQEQVARDKLNNAEAARKIAEIRAALPSAQTVGAIRILESQAGAAYWFAWRNLSVEFPKADLPRVPEHWRTFGSRISPLTGSPRKAANPANAILNYFYALLEAETTLASAALGLDPGLGFLHVDTPARDSLACDLMEPIRPKVDALAVDWLRMRMRRNSFFEMRDGNCRLMAPLAVRLSETIPLWRQAVAPIAEWVARALWLSTRKSDPSTSPATRLTQRRKREAKDAPPLPRQEASPQVQNLCTDCGAPITTGASYCPKCAIPLSVERLVNAAVAGRVATQGADAQARRAATLRRHHAEMGDATWRSARHPAWVNKDTYMRKIQPLLAAKGSSEIARALGVSVPYATNIRKGRRIPHPRHWEALAKLVGIGMDE